LFVLRSVTVQEVADAIYQQTGRNLSDATFTIPEIKAVGTYECTVRRGRGDETCRPAGCSILLALASHGRIIPVMCTPTLEHVQPTCHSIIQQHPSMSAVKPALMRM
jgi:hypothetical protein